MAKSNVFQLRITGPDGEKIVELKTGVIFIGRQPGNDLLFDSTQVSRRHAQIETKDNKVFLTDLGSSNGTWMNGERLVPQTAMLLAINSKAKIGPFEILLEQKPEEPKPAPAEKTPPASKVEPAKPAKPPAAPPPAPPEPPKPPPAPPDEEFPKEFFSIPQNRIPDGLTVHSQKMIHFLPGIYHTDFMSRFLALFESLQIPLEWNIDGFDLFLSPGTAPKFFLPWLANWYKVVFDSTWSEEQQRAFLREAHELYCRRGTRWSLGRLLEIYAGKKPEIDDLSPELEPHTFTVRIPLTDGESKREMIEKIIDHEKPAHTLYTLKLS